MTKAQHLEILMLILELENRISTLGTRQPDYLYNRIASAVDALREEISK